MVANYHLLFGEPLNQFKLSLLLNIKKKTESMFPGPSFFQGEQRRVLLSLYTCMSVRISD